MQSEKREREEEVAVAVADVAVGLSSTLGFGVQFNTIPQFGSIQSNRTISSDQLSSVHRSASIWSRDSAGSFRLFAHRMIIIVGHLLLPPARCGARALWFSWLAGLFGRQGGQQTCHGGQAGWLTDYKEAA